MKKRFYETAEMEIELYSLEDVICNSPGGIDNPGGGEDDELGDF